jgi:type II secretory pathway predicted ATPase ExeA
VADAGLPPIRFSPAQEAALGRLRFALEARDAIVVLCGPAGTGVTLLLGELLRTLEPADQLGTGGAPWTVPAVVKAVRETLPLPGVLVIDDAHLASAEELAIVASATAIHHPRRPRGMVLGGRGRLLTLVSRDSRIAARVPLRAIVPPFTLDDSRRLVLVRLPGPDGAGPDEEVIRTIHEIAAGIPAKMVRLLDIAAATAGTSRRLSVDDVETIHRRLDPFAV